MKRDRGETESYRQELGEDSGATPMEQAEEEAMMAIPVRSQARAVRSAAK